MMVPTTVALIVVQEMAARMGAVTGKGLSDLIREEFGFRVTFLLMLALVVINFGNVWPSSREWPAASSCSACRDTSSCRSRPRWSGCWS